MPLLSRTLHTSLAAFFCLCLLGEALCSQPAMDSVPQVAAQTEMALIPEPREWKPGDRVPLPRGLNIHREALQTEDLATADDLRAWCDQLQIPAGQRQGLPVRLLRREYARDLLRKAGISWQPEMHDEGYVIMNDGDGVALIAETSAGLFYAEQTLKQLLHHDAGAAWLQKVTVRDWPAMRYRGFSDDITRGGLPTMEFFKKEIRTFAAYKLNVFSLYMQTTFRYDSMPAVPPAGGALTPREGRELAEYARQYHVMLIPEQESFAHLHGLLASQRFSSLAETPMGGVLAPGQPGSLRAIDGWFKQLADTFPAAMLHIGADETFDLGKGQTREAVQQHGATAVYVDFVVAIHHQLQPLHPPAPPKI